MVAGSSPAGDTLGASISIGRIIHCDCIDEGSIPFLRRPVTQLVECMFDKHKVNGSIPFRSNITRVTEW